MSSQPSERSHAEKTNACHVGLETHAYCPQRPTDSRSPCPALNTLANHGYLNRNGRNITAQGLVHALEDGYQCSAPLAYFLAYGGLVLLGQYSGISLSDLARHNQIEHDASLAHLDAGPDDEYAPTHPNIPFLNRLLRDSQNGQYFTAQDIGAARVRRESEYTKALDALHAEIARGEVALVLGIFRKDKDGPNEVPLNDAQTWWKEERFPDGWKPNHTQGFLETVRTSSEIRHAMQKLREDATRERIFSGEEEQ